MRRHLIPAVLVGVVVTGVGTARTARAVWDCPAGFYPDVGQALPNCESATRPVTEDVVVEVVRKGEAGRQWDCAAGTYPDDSQQLPNCLSGMRPESDKKVVEILRPSAPVAAAEPQAPATAMPEMGLEQRVGFELNSAALDDEAKATLDEVASDLKAPDVELVVIEGHTDSTGTAEINEHLSEKRAEAVREYLEEQGVPGEKFETKGLADTQPLTPETNEASRAENRAAVITTK